MAKLYNATIKSFLDVKRPEHRRRCNPHWPPVIGAGAQKATPEDSQIVVSQRCRREYIHKCVDEKGTWADVTTRSKSSWSCLISETEPLSSVAVLSPLHWVLVHIHNIQYIKVQSDLGFALELFETTTDQKPSFIKMRLCLRNLP